jgi:signal transduction histidine kinase/ActR/RegA family two-component response regulator
MNKDPLLTQEEKVSGEIARVETLLEEAHKIRVHNLQKSIALATEALHSSERMDNEVLIATSLSRLAYYFMISAEYRHALIVAEKASAYFEKLGDERSMADVKYTIASIHYKTTSLHLGLKYLTEALTVYRKYDDHANLAKSYKVLGTIYEFFGNVDGAIESYESSVMAAERVNDDNLKSNAFNPLSGLYLNRSDFEKAMSIIETSITLKQQSGDIRGLAFSYYGRGKIHTRAKAYELAEQDFNESIRIHLEMGEVLGLGMALQKMGVLYLEQGKYEQAVAILKRALALSEVHKSRVIYTKSSFLLYQAFKKQGNIAEALHYLELYQAGADAEAIRQTDEVVEVYKTIHKMEADIREEKMQREKADILRRQSQAEYAARAKQDFLSNMSHEIRTPLNAVITITNLMKERADPEDQQLLESLRFASNNLLLLINDVLDFTKLDTGKVSLEMQPANLRTLLHNIRHTYQGMAMEKGLELLLEIGEEVGAIYEFDETKLAQILGNLLSNAIKFTENGRVKIEVEYLAATPDGHQLRFRIIDTGIGIEPAFLREIFDTFTQPKSVTTQKHRGSGLGLAIVKKLSELYNSEVIIETEQGAGSTFMFTLTLKPAQKQTALPAHTPLPLDHLSVLLVEDNTINVLVATRLLQRWGITPDCAKNGLDAVQKSLQQKYDVVLMDIHMPEMNGYDATIQIRQQGNPNYQSPIYALTADINVNLQEEYVGYFDGVLRKPIEVNNLYAVLEQINSINVHSADHLST